MSERKNLTITQVEEVKKVGDNQIPKLSFRARDGGSELSYFTFKPRFFDLIKEGQTINADVETEQRGEYTNRRVVQIYVDGQPVSGRGGGSYRGKSPEELEQQARVMVLSYAKDLAVAQLIPLDKITDQADIFHKWLKGNGNKPAPPAKAKRDSRVQEPKEDKPAIDMTWLKESLEELNWADVSKWLKSHYPEAKGTTIKAIAESLTREHQEEFVKEVQKRLEVPQDIFSQ